MRNYILLMLMAAAVSYLCTPMARSLAQRMRVFTPIRARDVHSEPVPRLGGMAIFLAIGLALLVASQMSFLRGIFEGSQAIWGILAGAAIVTVVGIADDVWDLHWMLKLAGQILAAFTVAWLGVRIVVLPIGELMVESIPLQYVVTIFLIVLTMNAINFVDGLDGLAAGVAVIGGVAFFVTTYWVTRFSFPTDYSNLATLIMAALIGACVGFLPHNFFPAKIFMGDAGSMLIGLLLASSAIAATTQIGGDMFNRVNGFPAFMPILLPFAVMLLPLLDLVLAVARRTARRRSPFSADRGHLHHKLIDAGYSHPKAVLMMYLWSAIIAFGVVAFAFFPWQWVLAIDAVVVVAAVTGTLHPWVGRPEDKQPTA
ncbi:MraY family glycosyltransferase [Arthrobacter sp. H14]|uniref:MraY family glycosyltransferase n=1 Tax=Arthrobacter sp. H14 TaxID=1312959 RepID=UPI00047ABD7E|nr:MraY family glycosyltransferase [Arthrobacter sp. H14]